MFLFANRNCVSYRCKFLLLKQICHNSEYEEVWVYLHFCILRSIILPFYFVSECQTFKHSLTAHQSFWKHRSAVNLIKKRLFFFKCKSNGVPHACVALWEQIEWHWRDLSMEDPSGSPCMTDTWLDRTVLHSQPSTSIWLSCTHKRTHRAKVVNSQETQSSWRSSEED